MARIRTEPMHFPVVGSGFISLTPHGKYREARRVGRAISREVDDLIKSLRTEGQYEGHDILRKAKDFILILRNRAKS